MTTTLANRQSAVDQIIVHLKKLAKTRKGITLTKYEEFSMIRLKTWRREAAIWIDSNYTKLEFMRINGKLQRHPLITIQDFADRDAFEVATELWETIKNYE